jgi:hypothetical protein
VDGEDAGQAGEGKDAPYLPAGRGQQQVTAGLVGLLPGTGQHAQAAAVDEPQFGQVDDEPRAAAAASAAATLAASTKSSSPRSVTMR